MNRRTRARRPGSSSARRGCPGGGARTPAATTWLAEARRWSSTAPPTASAPVHASPWCVCAMCVVLTAEGGR